ncbi:HMG box-containing protein 4 [Chanos chanos]|uniref:HMG box-containing protein 4 n=1 Tax=Chanos chanos TaxID=29144 RepID=A0A6J2VZD5_CHACN|nr:HMG box-containing protein 4-like [Chanos chanos]
MEGEVSLVAGRSQREKRRSYKDLLREEEEIDAQVRKSSKKRPKELDGFYGGGEFPKKKKKRHDEESLYSDYGSGSHHKKKKKSSDGRPSASSSASSFSPQPAVTAMGLLQAITSPMARGSEPSIAPPKKPMCPPMFSSKDRRRDGMMVPKSVKKKQHVQEPLPIVGEEVELEGHYAGPYGQLDDDSSSSSSDEELEAGELVIDDSYSKYTKKTKKSKKSKKKKDKGKEKERKHSSKASKKSSSSGHSHGSVNGSAGGEMYVKGGQGSFIHDQNIKKKKKEEKARFKAEKEKEKEKVKRKSFTAYNLFCKEYRISINEEQPGLDFGVLSKKLADAWKQLPEGDKQVWRERAHYLHNKQMKSEASPVKQVKQQFSKPPKDTTKAKVSGVMKRIECVTVPSQNGAAALVAVQEPARSPVRDPDVDPIDAAAHLQLLGESLSLIGRRLQETEGMVTVSGSLSVLLDSVLCALGPLACLTAQVPELNGCPQHVLSNTLDNIAYVMPGL